MFKIYATSIWTSYSSPFLWSTGHEQFPPLSPVSGHFLYGFPGLPGILQFFKKSPSPPPSIAGFTLVKLDCVFHKVCSTHYHFFS
uniref:Uncharacterized protein n=1 Tax=Arion vulgaris TaxID=1028688 RepID=A0A0B6YXM5_9EUPU